MEDKNRLNGKAVSEWTLNTLPDMSEQEFTQWQMLVEQRTGMSVTPQRRTFLQTNLRTRMREIGCQSYTEYLSKVTDSLHGLKEWMILVDRLTVQETRFYRDDHAYELVKSYLQTLPRDFLEARPIEVWSVGCATGEESYTLAMVVESCLINCRSKGYYAVTGTDISMPALVKARAAKYSLTKLVSLSKELRENYFNKVSAYHYQVIPRLKQRVCFARMNVMEIDDAPMDCMNIIFCQNLLIYFKRWRRRQILNRLAERLAPGGLLILGLGEVVDWHHPLLERVKNDKTLAFIRQG